ncbi:TerB family tellurite resistance protein [Gilvibacter sp.]|uniref:TerB family tellurite resistance protein n=1 Tax=Gilvibacter sp. TaxID=2729997 RepID=UPI003B52732C
MEDKEEKLGLLSDLIALAQADHHISEEEYQFIMTLAKRFDIDKETVHDLFHNPVESKPIVTELGRITHFHKLVLMMNIDLKTKDAEVAALRNFGLKMGIRMEIIDQVMLRMDKYENKLIPTEELVRIFQTYYN